MSRLTRLIFPLALTAAVGGGCHPPPGVVQVRKLLAQGDLGAARKKSDALLRAHPAEAVVQRTAMDVRLAQQRRAEAAQLYRSWKQARGADQGLLRHLALGVLRSALSHRDPAVRLEALQAARRTDADELEQAVAARLHDPDEVVRSWAAVALSRSRAGADMLERQLQSPSAKARAIVVEQLGRLAGNSAVTTLGRFATDPSPKVRAALARALAYLSGKRAVALLRQLARDDHSAVRSDALTSMGQLGEQAPLGLIEQGTRDRYLGARLAAVMALARLDRSKAVPRLKRLALGDDLPTALRAGVRLAKLGQDEPALIAIAKALVDRRWSTRAAACNAAASLRPSRVARSLVAKRALRDPEPRVRAAAARAVLTLGDAQAALAVARRLRPLACEADSAAMEPLCEEAADLLARAGDAAGPPLLRRLAREGGSAQLRRTALRHAIRAGASSDLLVTLLADASHEVALDAAVELFRRTGGDNP